MYLESKFKNETAELFTAPFTLEGSSEELTFIQMMNELNQLKSPFFGMFREEKTNGTTISQIIAGKMIKS